MADIDGTDGNDTLKGGAGNDLFYCDDGNDRAYGLNGDDVLYGGIGSDRLYGGPGDDSLLADYDGRDFSRPPTGRGDDYLSGGSGNDFLGGNSGDDTLLGGAGRDHLGGDYGRDVLRGGSGNDSLSRDPAGELDRLVHGGPGIDRLWGSAWDFDLTAIPNSMIRGIEIIDLTGSPNGGTTVTLNESEVLALSDTRVLKVFGDGSDAIDIEGPFTDAGMSGGFHKYKMGSATLLVETEITDVS
jgi:Ca2+-binding RTX toxin-like protein